MSKVMKGRRGHDRMVVKSPKLCLGDLLFLLRFLLLLLLLFSFSSFSFNINVRNFNFPIGFYSNPHPLWTPQNMTSTPLTTKLMF
jgi:uncharacterized membrane protein